jgi:hypothetical protein
MNASPAALPVLASRRALLVFAASIAVTLAIYLWIHELRTSPPDGRLTPMFRFLFTRYDYYGAICTGLLLVLAVFFNDRFPAARILRWIGERPGAIAAAATLANAAGAWWVFQRYPLSMDEYAPYFQSQVFAAFHLTSRMPVEFVDWFIPRADQVLFFYVSHDTGQAISFYWPSFALLLTPFQWLGIPWALNPLLSGLTVLVVHRLAMRIFDDREAAGLALLFTLASPVFFANGASYYSMTAHMLVNGLFALLLLDPTPRRLLAAGLAGSIALTLHNPLPHIFFALPWLLWVVLRGDFLRRCLWLAAGYLPLCILLGVGWYLLGQSLVSGTADASPNSVGVASYFRLPNHVILNMRLVGLAKLWLWAAPAMIVLAAIGAWRWRRLHATHLLLASGLLTALGYFFLGVEQGHGWGYRYFHSAWVVLPLLAAAAFARVPGQQDDAWSTDGATRVFVVACALLSLCAATALRTRQIDEFVTAHLSQTPQRPGTPSTERVEIYDASENFYIHDLVQNDPFLRDPVVRVISHGPEANEAFMRAFRPGYVRTFVDTYGEVWEPPPR